MNQDDHRRLAFQQGYINGLFAAFAALVETLPATRRRAFAKELKRQSAPVVAAMVTDDDPDANTIAEGFATVLSTLSEQLERKPG